MLCCVVLCVVVEQGGCVTYINVDCRKVATTVAASVVVDDGGNVNNTSSVDGNDYVDGGVGGN